MIADGKTYDFHLLPSGLLNPKCMNLIGSGTVVSVPQLFRELSNLEEKGLNGLRERLLVSDRCHIITDLHQQVDGLEEQELGANNLGTTKRGIGPTYSSTATRNGITIGEMFNETLFERKLRSLAAGYKKRYGDLMTYDIEEELSRFKAYREDLRPLVVDAVPFMFDAQQKGMKILVEGAQAVMLDVTYGTYPYVTSSHTVIGGAITGVSGLSPFKLSPPRSLSSSPSSSPLAYPYRHFRHNPYRCPYFGPHLRPCLYPDHRPCLCPHLPPPARPYPSHLNDLFLGY